MFGARVGAVLFVGSVIAACNDDGGGLSSGADPIVTSEAGAQVALVVPLPAGEVCEYGGQRVDVGVDAPTRTATSTRTSW